MGDLVKSGAGKLLFGRITSKEKKGSWVKIYIKVFLHE